MAEKQKELVSSSRTSSNNECLTEEEEYETQNFSLETWLPPEHTDEGAGVASGEEDEFQDAHADATSLSDTSTEHDEETPDPAENPDSQTSSLANNIPVVVYERESATLQQEENQDLMVPEEDSDQESHFLVCERESTTLKQEENQAFDPPEEGSNQECPADEEEKKIIACQEVLVNGFSEDTTEDVVDIFFEKMAEDNSWTIENFIWLADKRQAFISFSNPQAAESLANYSGLGDLLDLTLTVELLQRDPASIEVRGFKPGVTKAVLKLYFESRRSGGGKTKDISIFPHEQLAIVTFVDEEDAENVLKKENLVLQGCKLNVVPLSTITTVTVASSETSGSTRDDYENNTVLVSGLPATVKKEIVKYYFESKKRSGGGEIKEMQIAEDGESAAIIFTDANVAKHVSERKDLKLGDSTLRVRLKSAKEDNREDNDPEISAATGDVFDDLSTNSCAVAVSGMATTTEQRTLKMYFESRRRSGGGPVVDMYLLPDVGSCVLSFAESQVVDDLFQQEHTLEGHTLKLVQLNPVEVRQVLEPTMPNAVLVRGIASHISRDELVFHLENLTECNVKNTTFGHDPHIGLIEFNSRLDIDKLWLHCCRFPFLGTMLGIERVAKPLALQIFGLEDISIPDDTLEMRFESKSLTGGCDDNQVTLNREEGYAIVTCPNEEVYERMLRRTHVIDKVRLDVRPYHECLGILPPGLDTTKPSRKPEGTWISGLDPDIAHFVAQSKRIREELNLLLVKEYGELEWHSLDPENDIYTEGISIYVKCLLPVVDVSKKARKWEDHVKRVVEDFFSQFKSHMTGNLEDVWEQLLPDLEGIKHNQIGEKELKITVDANNHTVTLTGYLGDVEAVQGEMENKLVILRQDIGRAEHTEVQTVQLRSVQVKLLEAHQFRETIHSKCPKLEIVIKNNNDSKCSVEFHGLKEEILSTHFCLAELLSPVIQYHRVPTQKLELLGNEKIEKYLYAHMQNQGIITVWEKEMNGLMMCSLTVTEIESALKIIESEVLESTVSIPKTSCPALQSDEWRTMISELKASHCCVIDVPMEGTTDLGFVSISSSSEEIIKRINDFLGENACMKKTLILTPAGIQFILQHMTEDLKSIISSSKATVNEISAANGKVLEVAGTKKACKQAGKQIRALAAKILSRKYAISKPGMMKYFQSERGKLFFERLEAKFEVVILISDHADSEVLDTEVNECKELISVQHEGGPKISVWTGDLASFKADVIVNAANQNLQHTGGLAGALASKGGPIIQEESSGYIDQTGPVEVGGVAVTSGGLLPCKKLIHAVGPEYKDGLQGEEADLHKAVTKSLQVASELNASSIALPAISTGIFHFPVQPAASIITAAIQVFFNTDKTSPIKEVHLVSLANDTSLALKKALELTYGLEESFSDVMDNTPLGDAKHHHTSHDDVHPKVEVKEMKTKFVSYGDPMVAHTAHGGKVSLVVGDLAATQVDAIVNPATTSLKLEGRLSSALGIAAGPGLAKACQRECERHTKVTTGQVILTGGYSLPCNHVIHAVVPLWSGGKGEQGLRELVKNILEEANQLPCRSLALPAIGTGVQHIQRPVVAKVIFDEIHAFSQSEGPKTSLKDIRIVLFQGDTASISTFTDELNEQIGMSMWSPKDSGKPLVQLIEGGVTISIMKGSIADQEVDVIMNSTSSSLSLTSGGVSSAISKAAGPGLQKECSLKGTIAAGEIIVTDSYNLKCQIVFHGFCSEWDEGKGGTEKVLRKLVTGALTEANKSGLKSLAFPAIGTGTLNIPRRLVSKIMIEEVISYLKSNSSQLSLKDIRFVLYENDQPTIDAFMHEMKIKPGAKLAAPDLDTDIPADNPLLEFAVGNATLKLIKGSIATQTADVIVNTTSLQLSLSSGAVSASILAEAKKAGVDLQKECQKKVPKGGMNAGKVLPTKGYKPYCTHVLHGGCLDWNINPVKAEKVLREFVRNSLAEAEKLKAVSIAFPAVGTGGLHAPPHFVSQIMYEELKSYKQKTKPISQILTEILFVVYDLATVKAFYCELKPHAVSAPVPSTVTVNAQQTSATGGASGDSGSAPSKGLFDWLFGSGTQMGTATAAAATPPLQNPATTTSDKSTKSKPAASDLKSYKEGKSPTTLMGPDGLSVTILYGNIAEQQVNILVNSTGPDLDLKAGAVSSAILKTAGDALQVEVKEKAAKKGKCKDGDILITAGHKLHAKHVLHVFCPTYHSSTGKQKEQVLRQLMITCLWEANKLGHNSIAFPAIGAGKLMFPPDLVARVLFEEVLSWALQTPTKWTLKEVYFIIYDKDEVTKKAFTEERKVQLSGIRPPPPMKRKGKKKLKHRNGGKLLYTSSLQNLTEYRQWMSVQVLPPPMDFSTIDEDPLGASELASDPTEKRIGQVLLTVDEGDIANQTTEGVIQLASTGADIPAPGYSSRGVAIMDGPGEKGVKKIFHVRASSLLEDMSGTLTHCLHRASELELKSLAVCSSLDTDLLQQLVHVLKTFQSKHVREVKVVYPKKSKKSKGKNKLKSAWNQVKDALGYGAKSRTMRGDPGWSLVMDPHQVTFTIHGLYESSIDAVKKQIDAECVNESLTKRLGGGPGDQLSQSIHSLSQEQVNCIHWLEEKHGVMITLNRTNTVNEVVIQGASQDVLEATEKVLEVCHMVDYMRWHQTELQPIISEQVLWKYLEDGQYKAYSPAVNALIEKHYREKKSIVTWAEEMNGKVYTYMIDFAKNQETMEGDDQHKVDVFRKELSVFPDRWEGMRPGEKCSSFELATTDTEYHEVELLLKSSMGKKPINSIVKIERIQNPSLYERYVVHRQSMEKTNSSIPNNELRLFHGTDPAAIPTINNYGFDRGYAGKNNTLYGFGVYFATTAEYSHGFAKADKQGLRHMYLARVLVGEYTQGKSDMKVPPPKDPKKPYILYDSVVNTLPKPSMYVIFNDTQAYPEYLIVYK